MPRGHALGNVGNNLGNAAHDVGRKHLVGMKGAQDLSVVVLFGQHNDCAAKAKALRPMYTAECLCYQGPIRSRQRWIGRFLLHFGIVDTRST